MKISILDPSPIRAGGSASDALAETVALATHGEQLGYHRFWVAEHHASPGLAGSVPEILISYLSARTSSIRLGSGGVLLNYYSPLHVAESFRTLTCLSHGRIDLGIGRGPGGGDIVSTALREGVAIPPEERFASKLDELMDYLGDAGTDPTRAVIAMPSSQTAPEVWILGSGRGSAAHASAKGCNYCFAYFISGDTGREAVQSYRHSFCPSPLHETANAMICIAVVCAETTERANELASSIILWLVRSRGAFGALGRDGGSGVPSVSDARAYTFSSREQLGAEQVRSRMVIGDPQSVHRQLLTIAHGYGVDELMIVSPIHEFAERIRSFELVAQVCGLRPARAKSTQSSAVVAQAPELCSASSGDTRGQPIGVEANDQ